MKKKLTGLQPLLNLILAALFLTVSFTGNSQGIGRAGSGQLSDQQIMMLWQQAQMSGMSEADLMRMLGKQGFSTTDLNGLKQRLSQLKSVSSLKGVSSKFRDSSASTLAIRDTDWIKEFPEQKRKSNIYGLDFFNSSNRSFEPNLKASTPANYILGPEDELTISLTGLNETIIEDRIDYDGNYSLPYAGKVNLLGLTIDQARQRIKAKMSAAYPALRSGKTQLFISLGNIKTIHVAIVGEAERPATYTVSALAGFFNLLYISGGPSENGSLRHIEHIRNNKVINSIDFYTFLQKGTLENIRLEDQDVIHFPVYEKHVTISGEVKKPAVFELTGKETLTDLLNYAGGLSDRAYKLSAKIVEMGPKERRVKDVNAEDFSYYIPKNGDSVYFGAITSRFENRVMLSGAVNRPGNYELTTNLTLKQLIDRAEGLRQDVFLNRGYINRVTSNGDRTLISFDLNNTSDIPLAREDSVYILSKDNLRDIPAVTVGGAVRSGGLFAYREGLSVEDVIAMAGGFTINAAMHKVQVSRLEKNIADTLANQLVQIITIDIDSALHSSSPFKLQPLDYVFVPELLNYRVLGNIKVRGEVLYPGDYTLERRDESVPEVIRRSGGVSPFASMRDAQVYRNGLRIGTDVLETGNIKGERFLLLPGDSIFIPRNQSFVEVSGAVFNPQIVDYSTPRFKYYISSAGGITDKAKLKRAYVQYTNGINRQTKHFLFIKSYPRIKPGSKIIVPEKTLMDMKPLIGVGEISAAAAILTALVTLFTVLKK